MSGYQATFERHEKKYILTVSQQRAMRDLLAEHMEVDEYGRHTISSVYMDTPDFSVIRRSLAKPDYKEKVRLRAYGTPASNDTVFLELKKKVRGVVYKRRVGLTLREAQRYLQAGMRPARRGQIFDEIDWSLRRTGARPAICISCERIALFGRDDPDFRVTFDFGMRYRRDQLSLARGSSGSYLISPDLCLMEVKVAGAMPLWLTSFLAENRIFPTSFSKYGTAYERHILRKEAEKRNAG